MMMVMVLQSIAILSDSSDTAFVSDSSLSAGSFVIFAHCEHQDDDCDDHVDDHDHRDYNDYDHHHYNY